MVRDISHFTFPLALVAAATVACSDDGGDGSGGAAGGSSPMTCPLDGDNVLALAATASDFTRTAVHDGGRTIWEATMAPDAPLAGLDPGETVALTVTFDPPMTVTGSVHQLNVTFEAEGTGSGARAAAELEPVVASTGTMAAGADVLPRLSTDADGEITTVTVGTISLLPRVGDTVSCLSIRFPLPASLYDFDDSSRSVALASGGSLTLAQVRVSASEVSEVALEPAPFGWE
jgi:hypothetical protein